MSSKAPMSLEGLSRVRGRARVGSRLKIEFVRSYVDDLDKISALANLVADCVPKGQSFRVKQQQLKEIISSGENHLFARSRTFMFRILKDQTSMHSVLAEAVYCGLIARMTKV